VIKKQIRTSKEDRQRLIGSSSKDTVDLKKKRDGAYNKNPKNALNSTYSTIFDGVFKDVLKDVLSGTSGSDCDTASRGVFRDISKDIINSGSKNTTTGLTIEDAINTRYQRQINQPVYKLRDPS
jgi:hypothetical protein